MQVSIEYQPSYTMAKVSLDPGEELVTEAGAMVGMSSNLELETKAKGGFLKSLARSALGGESFFLNTYLARERSDVYVAPALPGDMKVMHLSGETLLVQSGSFVAASPTLEIETKWGGAKTFFGGEGFIMLRVSGTGTLIISSFGAIDELQLGPGETFTVDTSHVVTFADTVAFNVRKVGNWKSTLLSGEGLVVDLTGPGTVTLQTRSQNAFLSWLIPQLPTPRNSG